MIQEGPSDEDSSSYDLLSLIGHLRDANHNLDKAKNLFVKLSQTIIKNPAEFQQQLSQNQGQQQVIQILLQYFEDNASSFEMYRGLIYISNLLLAVNPGISAQFLNGKFGKSKLITCLSQYYQNDINEEEQYQLLALIAQLIQSKGFMMQNEEATFTKEFIDKLIEIDLSTPIYGTKMAEFQKILSVITSVIVKQKDHLKKQGLLNQIKIFILEQLSQSNEVQSKKNLIVCLNYLLKDLTFSEVEIQKYQLLEILLSQQSMSNQETLLISSLKILRFLWRSKVCRNHMLQLGLIAKLSQLYLTQPELIHGFLLEIVQDTRRHEEILKFGIQQFTKQQQAKNAPNGDQTQNLQEVANLVRLMIQYFGYLKTNQALTLLGQGLFDFLQQQLGKQQDQQLKLAIQEFFNKLYQMCSIYQQQSQQSILNSQINLEQLNQFILLQQRIAQMKVQQQQKNFIQYQQLAQQLKYQSVANASKQTSTNLSKNTISADIVDQDKKPPYLAPTVATVIHKQKLNQQTATNESESYYEQSSLSTQDQEIDQTIQQKSQQN